MRTRTIALALFLTVLLLLGIAGCGGFVYNPASTYQIVGYVDVLVSDPFGWHIERVPVVMEVRHWVWVPGPVPYYNYVGPYYPGWSWYGLEWTWRWRGPHHLHPHPPPGPPRHHGGHHHR